MKNYPLHPLCSLFPRMSGYEFECLKLDIKENGQREPIITHDGMILDGGNRYAACIELGIEPSIIKFGGGNVATYVLSANLHRRHLLPGQQAAIVSCVQDWSKSQTKGHSANGSMEPFKDTTASRAKQSGVSKSTQKRADAVAKADPKLAAQVARGEVKLQAAVEQVAPQLASAIARIGIANIQEEEKEPEYTELDAAHDQISALQDMVAVGYMDATPEEKNTATELIKELKAEVKALQVTLAAVTVSRDTLMNENASLKRQCLSQARKLNKYESAGNAK